MIKEIKYTQFVDVMEGKQKGLFFFHDPYSNYYIGMDTRTKDNWVEEFETKEDCLHWLQSN